MREETTDRSAPSVSVLLYLPYATSRLEALIACAREALAGEEHEIVLLDDGTGKGREWSESFSRSGSPLKVIRLSRSFGESVAVDAALPHAAGRVLVTLPAGTPVTPDEIRSLVARVRAGADLVIGSRSGRAGSFLERAPLSLYRWLAGRMAGVSFRDFATGVRAFRREVVEEIPLYGEMIRFLPILAASRGYRVEEISIAGAWPRGGGRSARPERMRYINRLLDVLTLYFLLRFTKKPLRFFGVVGTALSVPGILITLYLFVDRVVFLNAIAGRPLLLLGILLMVLGVQTMSIGLIGEMIIFAHSRETRDYSVLEVLE